MWSWKETRYEDSIGMMVSMAKLLLRIGIAMLVLSILCRFLITTPSAMMGDNLAIIACIVMIAVAALYIRLSKRTHDDDIKLAKVLLAKDRKFGHLTKEPVYDPELEKQEKLAAMGRRRKKH